jgi:hypothetical protein
VPAGDIEIVRAKTEGDFRAIGELALSLLSRRGPDRRKRQRGSFSTNSIARRARSAYGVFLNGKIVSSIRLHILA